MSGTQNGSVIQVSGTPARDLINQMLYISEPPPDELEQIRQRKVKEEEEREKAKRRGNVKNVEL